MQPIMIADYACATGEGPLWHPDEKRLYWVDIPSGRILRYDPATGQHEICYQGDEAVGGLTLQADGSLLMFCARGAVHVWREGIVRTIIDQIADEVQSRFNDVFADPEGRVYCGTMPSPDRNGRLYRLDTDGSLSIMLEDVTCSNGMGFTPDLSQIYFTDSMRYEICLYDYDRATGDWSNRQVFVRLEEDGVLPDGMTVDAEGYVWSAHYFGGCVVRYAPDGTEVQRISIPAKRVTCPAFGGPDLDEMYITTAHNASDEGERGLAGALFKVDAGVRGVPEFRSRIGL